MSAQEAAATGRVILDGDDYVTLLPVLETCNNISGEAIASS